MPEKVSRISKSLTPSGHRQKKKNTLILSTSGYIPDPFHSGESNSQICIF